MAKFKVGDICVVIDAINCKELIGSEVTITGKPRVRYFKSFNKFLHSYETNVLVRGGLYCPLEHHLKLKKFPGEDLIMNLFKEKELVSA